MNNQEVVALCNRQSLSSTSCTSTSPTTGSPIYEKDLKVDKRILEIMRAGGSHIFPSANDFFGRIIEQTQVEIDFSSTFKDRQGNEIPIVKVLGKNIKNLEAASALIMEFLDPHRDKMTFNIDVPYNDHSYIIGKDGSRIKQLSRETGCHIHLPDCNKTSGKKSNKLSIAGTSFESIEQARNQIRKSLPLNIGFKAKIKSKKFVHIDTSSSEVQAIKRKYRVDVTFTNVVSNIKYTEVTINVKGGRAQLEEIKCATQELYQFVTGDEIYANPVIDFTISIDVSHSHHQYVKGKNNCNLKVIHQRSKSIISFPPPEMEINQVIIQGRDLISTVMGWQELMGYLPLLLSFDVNYDISKMQPDIQRLEKEYGVGIRIREKLCGHVYTVLIKTQERHSICLQEIRQRIMNLKAKADKMNSDENVFNREGVSFYKNLGELDSYVHLKSFNTASGAGNNLKAINPNYYNPYHAYSKTAIDQVNSYPSAKIPRLSVQHLDNYSIYDSYRNFSRKPKVLSKHSTTIDQACLSFPNQFVPDAAEIYPSKSSNLSPASSTNSTNSNGYEAMACDKQAMLPLKTINVENNMHVINSSFDAILSFGETNNNNNSNYSTQRATRPFPPAEGSQVDYSFARFTYQNQNLFDTDSGIGSSTRVMSPTVSSASVSEDVYNQENSFPRFFPKNFIQKYAISQANH